MQAAPQAQVMHPTDSTRNLVPAGEDLPMGRNVLLPIDDTDDAQRACVWAAKSLYKPGDVFHLLHVVDEPQMIHIWPGMYIPPDDDAEEEEVHEAVRMIRKRFTGMLNGAKIPFAVEIVTAGTDPSQVATVIKEKADELDAACIVMARHPKTKFQEFWRGSVSAEAAHKCKSPTVIV